MSLLVFVGTVDPRSWPASEVEGSNSNIPVVFETKAKKTATMLLNNMHSISNFILSSISLASRSLGCFEFELSREHLLLFALRKTFHCNTTNIIDHAGPTEKVVVHSSRSC